MKIFKFAEAINKKYTNPQRTITLVNKRKQMEIKGKNLKLHFKIKAN